MIAKWASLALRLAKGVSAVVVMAATACAPLGGAPQAATRVTQADADLERVVRTFYELRAKQLDSRGTPEDVDRLMALLTHDAVFEHPRANVTMTKEQARRGIAAHLNESTRTQITLRRVLVAGDVVFLERVEQHEGRNARNINGASVFEFTAGKIRRVAEY